MADLSRIESGDMPGAIDAPDTHYTIAQFSDCKVFHLYVGELPPGSYIGRRALCGVSIVRLAHPTETEVGRLCRRCEAIEGPRIGTQWEERDRRG